MTVIALTTATPVPGEDTRSRLTLASPPPTPQLTTSAKPPESVSPTADPLIDRSGEHIIYMGIFLLVLVCGLALSAISQRIESAVVFAIIVSALLILMLMV